MKRQVIFLYLLASCSWCFSQQMSRVMLYENACYTGRVEVVPGTLMPGATGPGRVLGEFNDRVSSVKVPAGMVVILYEHAKSSSGSKPGIPHDRSSGYGRYVELMEDCPDLSVYGLSGKVSYVTVFPATRPGFDYVRTKDESGKVIPGHWEKANADGQLPDNAPPAIVQVKIEPGAD